MKKIPAITAKELYTYFVSPVAYFVLIIFSGLSGFFFYAILLRAVVRQELSTAVMQVLFRNYLSVTLLFFTPAMTMRLFSEEKKTGTIELLMTSPIRDVEIVLGKYLASLILYLLMLSLTFFFLFLGEEGLPGSEPTLINDDASGLSREATTVIGVTLLYATLVIP